MDRLKHKSVIEDFLQYMNEISHDYILKGGTSLMECYGMERMSEDIDLDSINKSKIAEIVDSFCQSRGYTYNVNKNTDTVKRYMIHYEDNNDNDSKPLKVEVSYRKRDISKDDYLIKDGITVYNIDRIAIMKETAFSQRDKLRDLYDIVFICKYFRESLEKNTLAMIRDGFENKGLEYFDYITQTQSDELINPNELAENLLDVFDDLGIIADDHSKSEIMEQLWNDYMSLPKDERTGIEWEGKKLRPAIFEDKYLAQCEVDGRSPDNNISKHFWKKCVGILGYEPKYCSIPNNIIIDRDEMEI